MNFLGWCRLAEKELQFPHVGRKPVARIGSHTQGPQDTVIAAHCATQSEVDPVRIKRCQSAELLGDHERWMIRQHNASRPDADDRRFTGDVTNDHRRGGACGVQYAMMLGEPEAFEAERLNMAGKIDRLLKRLTWCFTQTQSRKIKYRKRNLQRMCKSRSFDQHSRRLVCYRNGVTA